MSGHRWLLAIVMIPIVKNNEDFTLPCMDVSAGEWDVDIFVLITHSIFQFIRSVAVYASYKIEFSCTNKNFNTRTNLQYTWQDVDSQKQK